MRASLGTMLALLFATAGAYVLAHAAQHGFPDAPSPAATSRFPTSVSDVAGVTFVADRPANRVLAVDARTGRALKTFEGMRSIQALLGVPALHRVFVATAGTLDVAAIDTRTLEIVARPQAGRFPTALAWDPEHAKLYAADEMGEALSVIDPAGGTRARVVPLGGEAGDVRYDPVERLVYVNVTTRRELAAVDPAIDAVVARYPLAGCAHNVGLSLDLRGRLAHIACGAHAEVEFDLRTRRQRPHS